MKNRQVANILKKIRPLPKEYRERTEHKYFDITVCNEFWARFRKAVGKHLWEFDVKSQQSIATVESQLFKAMFGRKYLGD